MHKHIFVTIAIFAIALTNSSAADYPQFSGVYPHLATYNDEGECGTGAVVPWADRLWYLSYGPHKPFGSSDKLYEVDGDLNLTVRPESVGGTHANRMIHRESKQLIMGWYFIDENRNVRVIPPESVPGRQTGNARHLTDPEHKVYFASMEEGFYEVDVKTFDVKTINLDGNAKKPADVAGPLLPGYHGKGLYSGQGVLVYANNGEYSSEARKRPDIPSGCLAEWDGKDWKVILRNQFTEVTGPGGIYGNDGEDDPIWAVGWDDRSLILMLREDGGWHQFRLPKTSHTYDGAHGWHTEWPRIREVGMNDSLMTMHGMFWKFPKTFSLKNRAGIEPLSSYLKIVGDFCDWKGKVAFGCDDAAQSEFSSNGVFAIKGTQSGQSNSNLWFVDKERLDDFGPAMGRGGPWKNDSVKAGAYSDPFLFNGFDRRMVHIAHNAKTPVEFTFEIDKKGTGDWTPLLQTLSVPASGYAYRIFEPQVEAQWIRVKTDKDCDGVTLMYQFADKDERSVRPDPIFDGLAKAYENFTAGIVRSRGGNLRTMHYAAVDASKEKAEDIGYYEIGADMVLQRKDDPKSYQWLKDNNAVGEPVFTVDGASILVIDSTGKRYRLPKGAPSLQAPTAAGWPRTVREIVTERSLFQCQGNWFELPRQNSGGFSKIRPIASTDYNIMDLCSWRGMMVLSGVSKSASGNSHIVKSSDGRCALWFGTIDDLWKLGKPRGEGSVWNKTKVKSAEPSDPYIMTGYDNKRLVLTQFSEEPVTFTIEVDITGNGCWVPLTQLEFSSSETIGYNFPEGFNAYWVRLKADKDTTATATFVYN